MIDNELEPVLVLQKQLYELATQKENMFEKQLQLILVLQKQINEMAVQVVNVFQDIIPKFELPDIRLPEIDINYEDIHATVKHNSQYGWTLTGVMQLGSMYNESK